MRHDLQIGTSDSRLLPGPDDIIRAFRTLRGALRVLIGANDRGFGGYLLYESALGITPQKAWCIKEPGDMQLRYLKEEETAASARLTGRLDSGNCLMVQPLELLLLVADQALTDRHLITRTNVDGQLRFSEVNLGTKEHPRVVDVVMDWNAYLRDHALSHPEPQPEYTP